MPRPSPPPEPAAAAARGPGQGQGKWQQQQQQQQRGDGPADGLAPERQRLLQRTPSRDRLGHESAHRRQRWNAPPINRHRYMSVNLSFFIMGMSDACIGALLPWIEKDYSVSYATVSTIFLVPFLGYVTAALCNNWVHHKAGQRGVALLGPLFRLAGYVPLALHPPFALLPVLLMASGFGNGIEDSAYNAWVGNMQQTNELLGIIHGAYALGATVAPLVATAMVVKLGLEWFAFYRVMIGVVCCELVFGLASFWRATGAAYRQELRGGGHGEGVATRTVLGEPVTWLVAVFLLGYTGAEVSLGGWIPTFMMEVRKADPFLAGVTATLFWLGLSLGRVVLGFVTGRLGEKAAITGYLLLCMALELLYWLAPTTAGAMVFVSLLGFFLGPLFPAAIVVATQLLPRDYHVSAIGFASAIGGGGAAVLPFAVGAMAERHGVQVLQPVILASLAFLVAVWLSLPRGRPCRGVTTV